jgi:iron complex outermembrane receptor protein
MSTFSKTILISTAMAAALSFANAYSQEAATSETLTDDEARRLNKITVTATKREQTLEEIPLAVTVFTGDELEQRNVTGFSDYLASVPGVQFNPAGNVFGNSISVRGVTDGTSSFLTQQPIALYLDDTLLTLSQGAINLDYGLFGVEQVNIIKGPNSTLYGASSLGGTIKVVTRRPSLDGTTAEIKGLVSSTEDGGTNSRVSASFSTPLIEDKLGVEFTGYRISNGGYIDSFDGASDINSSETYGGRVALRYQPDAQLTIDATAYYQLFEGDDLETIALDTVDDLIAPARGGPQFQSDEFFLGTLAINYDFGFAELTSSTSYFDRETETFQDATLSFLNFAGPTVPNGSLTNAPAEVFAQEVRLVSAGDGPVSWLVGGYYSTEDYVEDAGLTAGPPNVFEGVFAYEYETVAAFAEIGYDVTPDLTATVGGRYTQYDTSVNFTGGIFFAPTDLIADESETDFSPRLALNYEIDNGSVYIQASRGFRLGQANIPIPFGPENGVPEFFAPDSLWNYEVGAKTSWLNDRLTVNAAAYYIDWTDIQLTSPCIPCGGFTFISNVGGAEITGLEIESVALLTPSTTWTGGIGLINAETTDDVAGVATAGTRLPGSPELTFNTSLQQDFTFRSNEGFLRADVLYYGEYDQAFSFGGTPEVNGDYTKVDLRAGITVGGVDLGVFATNLTDERPILTRTTFPGPEVTTLQPRTIGVSLGYKY